MLQSIIAFLIKFVFATFIGNVALCNWLGWSGSSQQLWLSFIVATAVFIPGMVKSTSLDLTALLSVSREQWNQRRLTRRKIAELANFIFTEYIVTVMLTAFAINYPNIGLTGDDNYNNMLMCITLFNWMTVFTIYPTFCQAHKLGLTIEEQAAGRILTKLPEEVAS